MKKLLASAFAATAAMMIAASASATVINFESEVNVRGEGGVADGTVVNSSRLGNLNLALSAGVGGVGSDFAYFNKAAGPSGPPQGLGTCTRLNSGGQCTPSYDDVVATNEWVQVDFVDAPFDVQRLSFNGAGNLPLDSSSGLIKITTGLGAVVSVATMTFAQAAAAGIGLVDWIRFEFVDTEFVVAQISDIPVPGALPLLLSGLAGLGFAARRKKA